MKEVLVTCMICGFTQMVKVPKGKDPAVVAREVHDKVCVGCKNPDIRI